MGMLSIDTNAKTVKGQKKGWMTGVLYLAPAEESGRQVCPMSSPGCREVCLNTAGRGVFRNVQEARIKKTKKFFADRDGFLRELHHDIGALVRKAKREGYRPAVRLNGTSDLPWEKFKLDGKNLMEHYPRVRFYDYTKIPARARKFARGEMPDNYYIGFSRNELNHKACNELLDYGVNVSVVFQGKELPKTWGGRKVIDGDQDDLRFREKPYQVVGLRAKGRARRDTSGFVVQP